LVAVDTRKCNHSAGAKPWNVVIMLRDGAVMGLANTTRMAAKPAVAFGQVQNVQPASPLWQQFLLAAMAPVLTALFGGIFAQLIVARYQSRRRAAEEAEQARLRDHDLKM
jgi:glycerol uptake facilitator-like aquaporin